MNAECSVLWNHHLKMKTITEALANILKTEIFSACLLWYLKLDQSEHDYLLFLWAPIGVFCIWSETIVFFFKLCSRVVETKQTDGLKKIVKKSTDRKMCYRCLFFTDGALMSCDSPLCYLSFFFVNTGVVFLLF